MWRKLKQFLRDAEARTWQELQTAIAATMATVTAQGTINWFASCGYISIQSDEGPRSLLALAFPLPQESAVVQPRYIFFMAF
jgi:hypothetical protein